MQTTAVWSNSNTTIYICITHKHRESQTGFRCDPYVLRPSSVLLFFFFFLIPVVLMCFLCVCVHVSGIIYAFTAHARGSNAVLLHRESFFVFGPLSFGLVVQFICRLMSFVCSFVLFGVCVCMLLSIYTVRSDRTPWWSNKQTASHICTTRILCAYVCIFVAFATKRWGCK